MGDLEICDMFIMDSTVFRLQFYCSFFWIGGGGLHNWRLFMDIRPQKVLERAVIYTFIFNNTDHL